MRIGLNDMFGCYNKTYRQRELGETHPGLTGEFVSQSAPASRLPRGLLNRREIYHRSECFRNLDLAGTLTSWTHPSTSTGFQISYTVNAAQRVTQITSNLTDSTHPANLAESITYHPFGAVKQLKNGKVSGGGNTNQVETYYYNKRQQLYQMMVGDYDGSWRSTFCYQYNFYSDESLPADCTQAVTVGEEGNNGSIRAFQFEDNRNTSPSPDMDHAATISYDQLNRMTSSIATGDYTHNLDFSYGQYGNATCVSDGSTDGPCAEWSFDTDTNRISDEDIDYDAAGNMTADGTGSGTYSYAWDGEGRMKTATPNGGGNATNYIYNALGQRVEQYTGASYTEIVYDAFGNRVGLHNQTSWTAHWIPFNGRPFAKYQSGSTYFLHPNHLGSTTMVTDQTGTTIQKTIYYPWGQAWAATTTIKDDRFASMGPRDSETGNDPTLFRRYQPRLYRWLSPDPLAGDVFNPQSLNRYSYVNNNPVNSIDPLGLDEIKSKIADLCNFHPWGDSPCFGNRHSDLSGGCSLDGAAIDCFVANGLGAIGAAVDVTGIDTSPQHGTNGWSFFGCYADGSCGHVLNRLPGVSPLDIANAFSTITESKNGPAINPDSLSGAEKATYELLIGLGVMPGDITIYQAHSGRIKTFLSPEGQRALFSANITSGIGDAFLHYPYGEGFRDARPTNSLHGVFMSPTLTGLLGGGFGMYSEFHIDPDNPRGGSFWRHMCEVVSLCK